MTAPQRGDRGKKWYYTRSDTYQSIESQLFGTTEEQKFLDKGEFAIIFSINTASISTK